MAKTTKITKCSVYLANLNENINLSGCSKNYKDFVKNRFRFCDVGDDPSFFSSYFHNSNVTWGVCRHNVRQPLNIGDEVFFVACEKLSNKNWKYYLTGYGEVENKISQTDIYKDVRYSIYRKYFNLLIKPSNKGYEHWEPIPEEHWHKDWEVRLCKSTWRIQKTISDYKLLSKGCGANRNRLLEKESIIYNNFPFGENYIIFNKEKSFFNPVSPLPICEVNWDVKFCKHNWIDKEIEILFSNKNNSNRTLTNASHQHTVFNLEEDKSEKLKTIFKLHNKKLKNNAF